MCNLLSIPAIVELKLLTSHRHVIGRRRLHRKDVLSRTLQYRVKSYNHAIQTHSVTVGGGLR